MTRLFLVLSLMTIAALAACGPITPAPDYSVKVAPSADGKSYTAIPPECPRWSDNDLNFFDNQPLPQFGCADKRNLAMMVDQPQDLLNGRPMGPASGTKTAGSILRYNNDQTRGLLSLSSQSDSGVDATTASSATSSLSGETPAATSSAGK